MTKLLTLVAALLSAAPDSKQPFDLTVTLDRHDPKHGGTLICALFTTEAGFPLETVKAAQVVQARLDGPRATCTFQLERAGLVAVSVAHDENGNKTVDRNFLRSTDGRLGHQQQREARPSPTHVRRISGAGLARELVAVSHDALLKTQRTPVDANVFRKIRTLGRRHRSL